MDLFGVPDTSILRTVKTLQPAIKGDNSEEFIKDLLEVLSDIQTQTFANRDAILKVATSVSNHIHEFCMPSGPSSTPTILTANLAPTIADGFVKLPDSSLIEWNISTMKQNYLNPNFATYIKSKNVNLT